MLFDSASRLLSDVEAETALNSPRTDCSDTTSELREGIMVRRQPSGKPNWSEITHDFVTSVEGLQMGELLHDKSFGLFEAMSAIEMMDPKMDAGMACNRHGRRVKSFIQALQNDVIKVNDFTYSEMIGIIDLTLACIVSWLEGHSLAQTVFISLYLHRPHKIEDKTMRTFHCCIYKLMETMKKIIVKAMVYEEEDFQPMQYSYYLNPDVSDTRIISLLKECEEDLHKKLRAAPKDSEINGVHARIKFCRNLLQSLIIFRRDDPNVNVTDCNRLLITAQKMLEIMQDTFQCSHQDDDVDLLPGFEPLVNQRLLPPTFPRYTKIKTIPEALKYYGKIIERLKTITQAHTLTAFSPILDFFVEFSKTNPCLLSRSALQILFIDTSPINCKEILIDAVKRFISPPALMSKNLLRSNVQVKTCIDNFFNHCAQPFTSFLVICGHNRARQRDKLAHLLEDFITLQDEAERVDAFMQTTQNLCLATTSNSHLTCFGTWILYYTLKIMIMYLLSGFELELYSQHEYHYIFWYLYKCLYVWLTSALSHAESFTAEYANLMKTNVKIGPKKKGKYRNKCPRVFNVDIIYYQALQNMCGGYYNALMGFRLYGKLKCPLPEFDNERVRYEHRFAPFQNLLAPPPVHYMEFREMTSQEECFQLQQQCTPNDKDPYCLYVVGHKHFHQARQLFESIPQDTEIDELLKVCKTNCVVLKLLASDRQNDGPIDMDFSTSKYFPIFKIQ